MSRVSAACMWTARPKIPLSTQIVGFLRKHGTSNVLEIARGICIQDVRKMSYVNRIHMTVTATCYEMWKQRVLLREKNGSTAYYSVDKRKTDARQSAYIGERISRSHGFVSEIASIAKHARPEIRDQVLSEMYMRVASGQWINTDFDSLFDVCVAWVNSENRNGWRESVSVDASLVSDGTFSFLDILSVDEGIGHVELFAVERRVELINRLLSAGYDISDKSDLWDTSGTTSFWKDIYGGRKHAENR